MKKYLAVILGIFCSMVISGCKADKSDNFLESTELDYEKTVNKSSIENGLNVYHYCYYDLLPEDSYITSPEFKLRKENLDLEKTAIVVIDPWSDMPFPELNEMIEENVDNYILPVVNLAITNNMPVYIFTNNPDIIDYDTKICESLDKLVDNQKVSLLYYDQIEGGGIGFVPESERSGLGRRRRFCGGGNQKHQLDQFAAGRKRKR